MRIRFNHNTRDELVDGELLQDRSIDVRVTELDIPFFVPHLAYGQADRSLYDCYPDHWTYFDGRRGGS